MSKLNSTESGANIEGYLVGLQAYFNTLTNFDDELDLFFDLIQPLALKGMTICREVMAMPFEVWLTCDKPM